MPIRIAVEKRPNYFTGQLLDKDDFLAEQSFHMGSRLRHLRSLHTSGVVEGLELKLDDAGRAVVSPGLAIDRQGREIVLKTPQAVPLLAGGESFITASYEETTEDEDQSQETPGQYVRSTIYVVLDSLAVVPAGGDLIVLGSIRGNAVDFSSRVYAGAKLGPESVVAKHLVPGNVTGLHLAETLRTGWVRLPFKPSPFTETQGGSRELGPFSIGVTKTYCAAQGARGSMAIPVPMLANKVKSLLLAGDQNKGGIKVELHRCGWDMKLKAREDTKLLEQKIGPEAPFMKTYAVNQMLDPCSHALSVYIEAADETNISLVAAEFEWIPEESGPI